MPPRKISSSSWWVETTITSAFSTGGFQVWTLAGSSPAEYTFTVQTSWSLAVIFNWMYIVWGSSGSTV